MKNRNFLSGSHPRAFAVTFVSLVTLAAASTAEAATITWGAANNVTAGSAGDLDVSTAGTLVGAFNLGAPASGSSPAIGDTTVNGVTFTGLPLSGNSVMCGNFAFDTAGIFAASNNVGSGSGSFSTVSPAYQALLCSAAGVGIGGVVPFTVTMSGLVEGATYQFQWWCNNSRPGAGYSVTATCGDSITLKNNMSGAGANGGLGQFALGTFVADGTTMQSIDFSSTIASPVNGFQLRQLSDPGGVPDTGSTFALLGFALLGITALHRRFAGGQKGFEGV